MYAIIQTGGKQYRVANGDVITVEKLEGEPGQQVRFTDVRLVGGGEDTQVGTPIVPGASVLAEVADQGRGEKIVIFKMKRRKGYRVKTGHRQPYTEVKITSIEARA